MRPSNLFARLTRYMIQTTARGKLLRVRHDKTGRLLHERLILGCDLGKTEEGKTLYVVRTERKTGNFQLPEIAVDYRDLTLERDGSYTCAQKDLLPCTST